jgi:hypothetical protein
MLSHVLAPAEEPVTITPRGAPRTSQRSPMPFTAFLLPAMVKSSVRLGATSGSPTTFHNADGCYEEDEQWANVAVVFLNVFGPRMSAWPTRRLKDWRPDA